MLLNLMSLQFNGICTVIRTLFIDPQEVNNLINVFAKSTFFDILTIASNL